MILDGHTAKQANVSEPFDKPLRAAYLLTKSRELYRVDQGRNVRTTFKLQCNHWRPQFELTMKLSPRSGSDNLKINLENLHISRMEPMTRDKNDEKEVQILFTKGTSICSCTRQECACETENQILSHCFDELPKSTRTMMSAMSTPMILKLGGGIEEILTVNLALNHPGFAKEVRRMVFTDRSVMILLDVGGNIKFFNALKVTMQEGRQPLELFCPLGLSASNRFELSRFIANPMPQDRLGFQVSSVMKSANEFTVNGLARAELDRAPEVRQIKAYEDSSKTLILADFHEEKLSKHYEGLINRPQKGEYALQRGDRFAIQFGSGEWNSEVISWRATVTRTESLARKDMMSVLVHRGQHEDSQEYSEYQPQAISAKTLNEAALLRRMRIETGNRVRVKIAECESNFTTIRAAYMDLNVKVSTVNAPFRSRIHSILLGRRLDLLSFKDLYHHIRHEVPDPQKYMMPLNGRQLEIVQAARRMRGGMQFSQGAPGTGKTYTNLQQAAPFLAASTQNIILVAAPTNHGADDLTEGMDEIVVNLKEKFLHVKVENPYILRAYPEKVEDEIFGTQGRRFVLPPSEVVEFGKATLPASTETTDQHKLLNQARAADMPKFDGVHDKRVTDIEHSTGYRKLLISGIIPSSEVVHSDPEEFAAFRELYKRRAQGQKFTTKEAAFWESESDKLTKLAVQGASAIISTTATISKATLLGYVMDKVVAVFMDESAYEREDSLMPLFAAHFSLDPCFVMIGDHQQLTPLAKAEEQDNVFRSQIELSFMTRMINLGWEYTMLTEQHRMVPQISAIANTLTYEGELINDPSTQLCSRPLAQRFQKFTGKHYGIPTNRLMIDLPPSKTNIVRRNDKGSKFNDFSICIVAELVKTLLEEFGSDASIAVSTPYKGQRLNYEGMEGMMRASKLENFDMVTIDTLDGSQGREFDIVIFDLTLDGSAGFLESENRMNVAMTRARNGLIVVCDKFAIANAFYKKPEPTPYLKRMLRSFEGNTWTRERDDNFPKTKFYVPSMPKPTEIHHKAPRVKREDWDDEDWWSPYY